MIRSLALIALIAPTASTASTASTGAAAATVVVQDAPVLSAELLTAHPDVLAGRDAAHMEVVLAALEADPTHALARDAANLVWSARMTGPEPLDPERLVALAKRVTDAEASLTLRLLAVNEAQVTHFADTPLPMPDDPFPEFVRHWRWLGGGFGPADHPMPALLEDLPDGPETWSMAMPQNPFALETQWPHLERAPHRIGVTLAGRPWPDTGCAYLATLVRFDRTAVRVELRTTGAMRAWWNGTRILDEPRIDPLDTRDRFVHQVPVRADWNLLLLRVPAEQLDDVAARFLDVDGAVIRPVEHDWGEIMPFPMEPATFEPQAVDDVVALDVSDPFTPVLEVRRAWGRGRTDEALAHTGPEVEGLPRTAFRHETLRALQSATHLPAEIRRQRIMDLVQTFETEGPFLPAAKLARAFRLRAEDRPVEALAVLRDLRAASPEDRRYRIYEISVLSDLDASLFLAQPAIEALVRDHPEDATANFLLASHRAGEGDWTGAHEACGAALRADGTDPQVLDFAMDLARQDSLAAFQFRAVLERWIEREPEAELARDYLAEIDDLVGVPRAMVQLAEAKMERANVNHPLYMVQLGNALIRLGDVRGAHDAWTGALVAVPAAQDLWTSRHLSGDEDPAEAFFAEFAPDVDAALENARQASTLSVLEALDSGMVYLHLDGSSVSRFHAISLVGDRTGAELLHEMPVPEGVRLARVRKADGTFLEPTDVDGTWVLPAIEPGDAFETVWDTQVPVGFGNPPFSSSWRFQSFDKPFLQSRYVIYVPNEVPGELRVHHFEGSHEEIPWRDGVVHVFEQSSERASDEILRPSDREVLPWVVFAADRDPAISIGAWRAQLAALASVPADLEQELAAFAAGFDQADPLERARAIHEALDARVLDPQGSPLAAHVWLLGRGNRLFLFAALCERAGIDIHWALLQQGIAPELDPEPVRAFEGDGVELAPVLVVGDPAGACAWQIAPQPGMPFGMVPAELVGVPAWLLTDDGHEPIEVPRSLLDEVWDLDLALTYTLEANGDAAVEGRLRFPNLQGAMMRDQIEQAPRQQRDAYARQILGQLVQGLDPTSFAFPGLDGPAGPAEIRFTGRVAGFLVEDGQGWRGDLRVPRPPLSRELGPAERDWPLALRFSQRTRMRVRVVPGDAWRLASAPEPFREERDGLLYAFEATPEEQGWEVVRTYVVRGAYLEADEVPAFLLRLRELEETELTPLRFVSTR